MFYYVEGTVALLKQGLAVIDCGGVGYACHASQNTIGKLKIGARARLLTYLNVREDIFELYGFIDEEEQSCFEMMKAPGIGKKIAQRIVLELRDKMSKEQLETASSVSPVAMAAASGGVNHTQEAVAALMVLGYSQTEALQAMEGMDAAQMEAEEIIRQCLKKLVKQ